MSISEITHITLPPRRVPFLVRCSVLFGGVINQMGWLFFGFGLIFFWAFGLNSDVTSFLYFLGERETVRGTIISAGRPVASEGGSDTSEGTPIYANYYAFRTPDGRQYQGVSYATGRQLQEGSSALVEYCKNNPSISRIKGMRRAIFGPFGLISVLFPLVGFFIIYAGLKKGFKASRLLKHGRIGLGKLKSKVPTNTRINEQRVYQLTFEYSPDEGGTYEVVTKTHLVDALEDDEQEKLLYDPYKPSYAVMFDNLPGSPRIDELGNIRARSMLRSLAFLVIPLVTIIGHGIYIYLKYFY
jgi:hypothetical protein